MTPADIVVLALCLLSVALSTHTAWRNRQIDKELRDQWRRELNER